MKAIKETKPFRFIQWHMEHQGVNYFHNAREMHQFLHGFKQAEDGINDSHLKEGFWINDFEKYLLFRFFEQSNSKYLSNPIDLSESYIDYIMRIQESNKDGFRLYFDLLLEFAEAN